MKAYLGIDPGTVGAWAWVSDEAYGVGDIVSPYDFLSDMMDIQSTLTIALCALERGQSFPGQGIASTYKYGHACGILEGILIALGIPFVTVRPNEWMRGIPKGKDMHLETARRMFPSVDLSLKKHSHRSEALLLAYWASKQRP